MVIEDQTSQAQKHNRHDRRQIPNRDVWEVRHGEVDPSVAVTTDAGP